tara:strand:+ start:3346 stop:3627 length:282 start_codon:yes stop_codon:yes gene_type:complete
MHMSDLELDSTMGGVGTRPMLSEWMTRAELAAELDLTSETLCRWTARRIGPAPTQVGRKVLYRRETVRAWLLAQEQDRNASSGCAGQKPRGRR